MYYMCRLAESIKQMQDEIQKLGSNPVASVSGLDLFLLLACFDTCMIPNLIDVLPNSSLKKNFMQFSSAKFSHYMVYFC